MVKADTGGTITTVDGSRTITLEEFDRLAEEGSEEVEAFFDWSKAHRIGSRPGTGRLSIELTVKQIDRIHAEATRRGLTRDDLLAQWIEEGLKSLDVPAANDTAAE